MTGCSDEFSESVVQLLAMPAGIEGRRYYGMSPDQRMELALPTQSSPSSPRNSEHSMWLGCRGAAELAFVDGLVYLGIATMAPRKTPLALLR